MREVAEDYVEVVLDLVQQIPPGRATTYGVIAEAAKESTGRGSARTVGTVMARYGGGVPWWRVVTASGAAADRVAGRAIELLRAEGVPLTSHDPPRVDLAEAGWEPWEDEPQM
ncbi:MGMT family protein [Ruania halotolerans]|uniref:MGMT family protein n=1 Tax=Ruania halotolerans TaxID=2897773 RepID=UPI001E52C1EB|nr:MGMT family protein [Ruania halotolerans]UFU05298.1 MGMT family protein [Ruania halotolerans]